MLLSPSLCHLLKTCLDVVFQIHMKSIKKNYQHVYNIFFFLTCQNTTFDILVISFKNLTRIHLLYPCNICHLSTTFQDAFDILVKSVKNLSIYIFSQVSIVYQNLFLFVFEICKCKICQNVFSDSLVAALSRTFDRNLSKCHFR